MQNKKQNDSINLLDLFFYLLSKWKWFFLYAIIGVLVAYAIYSATGFTYFCSATIAIKDPENKNVSASLNRYDNLINKVNVTNEIYRFRSHKLMKEVVRRTNTAVSYKQPNRLRYLELYDHSPFEVTFPASFEEERMSFYITMLDETNAILTNINGGEDSYGIVLGDTLNISGVEVVIRPSQYLDSFWINKSLLVEKKPVSAMASYFISNLGIRQESEEASILKLSIQDSSPSRASAVLNALIDTYNEDVIIEKNQIAVNTAEFINERLLIIAEELGVVESQLEDFKKKNKVLDLANQATVSESSSQKYNSEILETQTRINIAKSMKSYLADSSNDDELIPVNTGLDNVSIESQITQYNVLKLRRDKLIEEGSAQNPIVIDLTKSMASLKKSIVRSVDNMVVSLEIKLGETQTQETRAVTQMFSMPQKERELLSIQRQQSIKESLYVFLLNKLEENALTQAMVDNNAQIINEVSGSSRPIAPNRTKWLILGFLLGVAIPGVWFLMKLFLDTRVQSRRDIKDNVSVPFLGEIPLDKDHQNKEGGLIVVDDGGHTYSEAFRILRTNMAFMKKKDQAMQVITFVSFNESAGKTFVSGNLAVSFAQAKKKVCVVDLDIRKGTMTSYMGGRHATGVTNYLYDPEVQLDDVIIKGTKYPTLDFIPAGSKAPNPAELLMDDRLDEMMAELRKRYEYIIVDNVPVGIIADATVSNRIADLTIFVVRAGKMDRRQLPELEELYKEKALANMAIVLNGTQRRSGGYGYGYGYGNKEKKKRFWQRKKRK